MSSGSLGKTVPSVRRSILVGIALARPAPDKVDIRIIAGAVGGGADSHEVPIAPVEQLVAVRHALGESDAVAEMPRCLALLLDQHYFTIDHDKQLIIFLDPATVGSHRARLQHHLAGGEATEVSALADETTSHVGGKRCRIACPIGLLDRFEIKLKHGSLPRYDMACR